MTPEQQAAYVIAQAACATAEVAGMQAENQARAAAGLSPAYVEQDFQNVVLRLGIHHNAVIGFFQ